MQLNPELAMHVARLTETRHLLCQYGCSYQAPSGLQPRLRRRLASEIIQESQPLLGTSTIHLMTLATLTSVVAIILLFAASTDSSSTTSAPQLSAEQSVLSTRPIEQRLLAPNQRATPLNTLSSSKYYSRFTHQPASFRHAYLSPSLFPLNAYSPPQPSRTIPLQADSYPAP